MEPARADHGRITRAVAGVAAAALIGAAIVSANREKHGPYVQPIPHGPGPVEAGKPLPSRCLKDYPVAGGEKRLVGRGCLVKYYPHVNQLPNSCEFNFRENGHPRIGYEPACLRNHGYSIG